MKNAISLLGISFLAVALFAGVILGRAHYRGGNFASIQVTEDRSSVTNKLGAPFDVHECNAGNVRTSQSKNACVDNAVKMETFGHARDINLWHDCTLHSSRLIYSDNLCKGNAVKVAAYEHTWMAPVFWPGWFLIAFDEKGKVLDKYSIESP